MDHNVIFATVGSFKSLKIYFLSPSGKLLRIYLLDRNLTVHHVDVEAYRSLVRRDMSQSSILGPLLSIMYSNDFSCRIVNSGIQMYADDVQLEERC